MISPSDAFARITAPIKRLERVTLPVNDCMGLTLAEDLCARRNQPPADVSAMDGYALHIASDIRRYAVIGTSAAGDAFNGTVAPGEAVRIYTGAEVPAGADTVIIQENTDWPASDSHVTLMKEAVKGANIRPAGGDFLADTQILKAGTRLRARHLGLATVAGYDSLQVIRRPVVALLSNGDELAPGSACTGASRLIPNSNAPMLAAMFEAAGVTCIQLGPAKDNPDDIRRCVTDCPPYDALITIGGASVGDRDFIQSALQDLGLQVDFWKIAMKPGKPLIYGTIADKPFMGLPGNPVSAFVTAFLYALPMLRTMMGQHEKWSSGTSGLLAAPVSANGPRTNFLRATYDRKAGMLTPCGSQDSSLLHTLANADGLIIQPPNCDGMAAGTTVQYLPFGGDV